MPRTSHMPRNYEIKDKNGRHGPSTRSCIFYAIPYSMLAIRKLDKKITATQKSIYRLPKCMSNAITQNPQNLCGLYDFPSKMPTYDV